METTREADQEQESPQEVVIIPSEASIKTVKSVRAKTPPPPYNEKLIENSRKYSRYVSYADIVITAAVFVQTSTLAGLIAPAVYQAFTDATPLEYQDNTDSTDVKVVGPIVLALSLNQLFSHMWGFQVARKLYLATDPETPQLEALANANAWRQFQVYKIVLAIILGTITSKNGPSVGSLNFLWPVVRIGFICVVHRFIRELEKNNAVFHNKSVATVAPVMVVTVSEKVATTSPSSAKSKA